MPATNAWDETKPAGSDLASTIDNQTRQLKLDIRERLALEHYWNTSLALDGLHKEITITPAQTNVELLKTTANQSLTGSSAVSAVDLGITWNTSGTPTAVKVTVTDTASNANSLLMDLRTLAGGSMFKVDKAGLAYSAGAQLTRKSVVDTVSAKWQFTAGIEIPSGVPGVTTNTLYSNGGTLFFNGSGLATGSSVSGTTGKLAKFTSASAIGDSLVSESGTVVTISSTATLSIAGTGIHTTPGTLQITANTTNNVPGMISRHASNGMFITGATGSAFDLVLANPSGASAIMYTPTGTVNANFNGLLTINGLGTNVVSGAVNGNLGWQVTNSSAGNVAIAYFSTINDAGDAQYMMLTSSAYTGIGGTSNRVSWFRGVAANGTYLTSETGTAGIQFITGGTPPSTNTRWGINGNGDITQGTGQTPWFPISTPTITSGFGGSATITGIGNSFHIVTSASANTGGTVNLNRSTGSGQWICVASISNSTAAAGLTVLPSGGNSVTIGYPSISVVANIYVHCFGQAT